MRAKISPKFQKILEKKYITSKDEIFKYHKNKLIDLLIDNKCFMVSEDKNFKLTSGKYSNFYIDCKKILLTYDGMYYTERIISSMNLPNFDYVAGLTSGADPIVCSVVKCLECDGLFIRKNSKGYGTGKQIEGIFEPNKEVLIVDDVLTTGNSISLTYDVLIKNKLQPVAALLIVDREEENSLEYLESKLDIPIFSIIKRTELINSMK